MGRKQSKKKKRYTFEQIKQFYQQGKYSQAFRALIKTKVAPYQKGQYLQLKVKLIQLLAYQFFVNHKYKAAYTQLLLSFKETAVEGFPLNLEYSQILMGLCQMYLGKFSEAIQLLDKSSLLPETKKFRFYYFLALIYDAKITDKSFDTFLEKHQSELSALSPNRIKYLQIAFHLVAKDFARAGELLDQYSALSHKHQINIHAIQAILGAKLSLSTNESAKIKTLYKALLGLALEQEELQYLSLFPTLSQKVNSSIQKEKHKSLNLFLNTLCIKGEALVKSQFEKAMSLADESIQPYMVYNQLSLLYNETEDDFSLIIYQNILKYDRAFFQIPESVFLYLAAIIRIDEEDFLKPGTFWNHIEQYLLRFKDSLSPKKIEQISWLIFYCIKAGKFEIAEGIFLNRIHGLAKNYPDMLGIKLWRIFESATISKVNKQYDWALDFINHRSIEDSQRVFLTELDGILSYLYPENYSENAFSIFDDYEDIINNSFLSAIERFTEQFDNSFESHQNSRKAFLILDYYHLMASYTLKLLKEDSTFFSHKAIQGFIKTYRKTIHFFEKDRELSLHHKSLKLLESFPQTTSLENALTEKLPTKELEELFRPYIQDGMATLVLNTIFKNINKTHFKYNSITPLAVFLLQCNLYDKEESFLFYDKYTTDLLYKYDCDHPKEYLCQLIQELIQQGKLHAHNFLFIHQLAKDSAEWITDEITVLKYNTVKKILDWLVASKKLQPLLDCDLDLVHTLNNYIYTVIQDRQLKGLQKTYKEVIRFFGASQKTKNSDNEVV